MTDKNGSAMPEKIEAIPLGRCSEHFKFTKSLIAFSAIRSNLWSRLLTGCHIVIGRWFPQNPQHFCEFSENSQMAKVWPHPIKAVIFDNDGTLMDTEWAYSWVHEQLTGHKLDWDLKPRLMSKNALETCQIMVEYYHMDITPEELVVKRTELVSQCWKDIRLLPGALELVTELEKRNIPLCIATSSRKTQFEKKAANVRDFVARFHHVITGSDITKGKPDPEIFLTALSKFEGVRPEEALVFEDAPIGAKGATNAGMPVVLVPDKEMNVEQAIAEQDLVPTIILPSLAEFNFELFDWNEAKLK
jgi:pseudouridine-5'-monophosphatase